mmetsp:Transcript_15945/g.47876  ORF Transcript_15945/g.47876 Transcript_15945/m.47876 type:complete len:332 (+) Transcript_15945:160-1155(+)
MGGKSPPGADDAPPADAHKPVVRKYWRKLQSRLFICTTWVANNSSHCLDIFIKVTGPVFILLAFALFSFITYTFFFMVLPDLAADSKDPPYVRMGLLTALALFLLANLVYNYVMAICVDPGCPPEYESVAKDADTELGEPEPKEQCQKCSRWKPPRTHHCSVCKRCVLKMDHHCPWINNCVGFYNRKFFIQLLLYVYSSLFVIVASSFPEIISRIHTLIKIHTDTWFMFTTGMVFASWAMALLLVCTLTNFIKFHLKLVCENYTTIENLEREEGAKSKFDIGWRRNWEQVFGSNAWLWWLPMHTQASRPIGDGVRWRVHYTRVIDEDEEAS